jgi:hypothetical protein
MSSIDLSNPKVLRNYLLAQIQEGRGNFHIRERVLVFRDVNGNEVVVPEEYAKDFDVVKKDTEEVIIKGVEPQPEVTVTGEVITKKKKKISVE